MREADEPEREHDGQDRLSQLSEASLRINDSLDFDGVLQSVLESARSLTNARVSTIVLLDDSGQIQDSLATGLTPEQAGRLWNMADESRFFEHTGGIQGYTRSLGLPELDSPVEVNSPVPFLFAPVTYRGKPIGAIYVGDKDTGGEFTPEDEEILVMFASQAALVIANARHHRDEQRARADLEALVNIAPVGVLVFDARTGVPLSVNRESRRIASMLVSPDVTEEELLSALTLRRADGRETSLQELPLDTALSSGETVRGEEVVIRVPDGRSVTALLNATPIHSDEGAIESFVVTLQDLTPLEEMERLRAEFLGMVSHELRTPLTSIRGSVDTLLDEESSLDPAEARQFHRIILEQVERMRGLISDLLDVAGIETGSLSVSPGPAELAALVDDARSTFLASGGRNNVRIELPPHLPLVMADKRRIVQVLNNLLSNADRHSPDSSGIRVTGERQGVHIAVSVSDHGRGIPAEHLPHLFQKFSRAEAGEQGGDTGLGLAICKGIVEAHGGRMWAESDGLGLGARFTFTLPAIEDALAVDQDALHGRPGRAPHTDEERPRILVVDDDPQTLRYVRDVLSKGGYTPSVTADPEIVARMLKEEEPHLVLLDLMLPGTDGIKLMKTVRDQANVPVIFLSAYGQDETIARAFEMGAADYVVKPFSPTELLARIRAALRRQAMPEQAEPTEPYVLGKLTINYPQREVTVAMRPITLTAIEYRLLFELSVNAGKVLTYGHLLQRVWGLKRYGDLRPMRTVVRNLRRKLGDDADNPTYIFTEPRVGYRMVKAHEPRQATTKAP